MLPMLMEPYMRKVDDHFEVHGGGMMFIHRQHWQAQIKLHWLRTSHGSSTRSNLHDDLGNRTAEG